MTGTPMPALPTLNVKNFFNENKNFNCMKMEVGGPKHMIRYD